MSTKTLELTDIYDLLYQLGLRANHSKFFYTSYAVRLACEQPEWINDPNQPLLKAVSKQYHKSQMRVEFFIQNASQEAWEHCPEFLSQLAGQSLEGPPTAREFVTILASHFA